MTDEQGNEGDGIACVICRGQGYVIGETNRVVCFGCGGDGSHNPNRLDAHQRLLPKPETGERT
jgi:hypothetical protein